MLNFARFNPHYCSQPTAELVAYTSHIMAFFSGPRALPPTSVESTTPISQAQAQEFLRAYLDRANTDPSLQPNAGISEHGPVSRTTAAAPNLILHNLKRVQAGLAGELLGRDLTAAQKNPGEEYMQVAAEVAPKNEDEDNDLAMNDADFGGEAEAFAEQEDGMDKEDRKRKKKERRLAEKKERAQKAKEEVEDSD
ncbi:unnamed protein product [Penicillium salamii]|nr:unnamed protein product [Penicillium salamii]